MGEEEGGEGKRPREGKTREEDCEERERGRQIGESEREREEGR